MEELLSPRLTFGVISSGQEEAHNAQNTSKVPTRTEVPSAHLCCLCFCPTDVLHFLCMIAAQLNPTLPKSAKRAKGTFCI